MTRRLTPEQKQLACLVAAATLICFGLAYRKYDVFGKDSGEIAYFDNMFWCTMQGRWFYASCNGISNLAVHAAFLWALLVPAYWLVPGVPTLLFMQSLFLCVTAIPIYLIARDVLKEHRTALLLAAAFLLLPPIISQHVNQVEEPSLLAVWLLFAFWFFQRERFGWFLVTAGIACLGRENVPLAIVMFGVYGLILRRRWKWVVAPLVGGAIYFWFAMFVVMPHFRHGHPWHVMRMFTYLGDTPGAIAGNALTQPSLVIHHLLSAENVQYVLLLLQPMAWVLPFFSATSLMALPDLAINTISDNSAMKVIPWHYNVITGCFLFVGTIYTVKRLGQRLRLRYGGNPELVMAGVLVALSVAHWFLWFSPREYHKLPYHETLLRALAIVPPEKSVITPARICSRTGRRERYWNLNGVEGHPAYAAQFEYVILDANERQYLPIITQEFFDRFHRNPKYKLIFAEQNVFVFQRLGGESDWKIRTPEVHSAED